MNKTMFAKNCSSLRISIKDVNSANSYAYRIASHAVYEGRWYLAEILPKRR